MMIKKGDRVELWYNHKRGIVTGEHDELVLVQWDKSDDNSWVESESLTRLQEGDGQN